MRVRFVQPLIPAYRAPFYRALARSGIDVEVWADLAPRSGSLDGIASDPDFHCVSARLRTLGPFIRQPAMLAAADPAGCDVLVLGGNVRHMQLYRTLKRARRRRLPTLLWMHGLGRTGSVTATLLRRRACRLASGAVAYSERVRRELIAEGMSAERVFAAPNGLDLAAIDAAVEAWASAPGRLDDFRRAEGLVDREVILSVGRLEPEKRPDLLIEAVALLVRRHPRALAVIIGKGSEEAPLRALASRLGVDGHMRFVGAIHDEALIAPWALSASMLVHPGAIGLTVFLAFGFGLPVITCDDPIAHGPEADAIETGRNGLLVPPGDAEALAEAAASLLEDSALRARLAAAASMTVRGPGSHSITSMVEGFRAAFAAVRGRS